MPPEGSTFGAMVGNVPRTYMRAHIMTGNDAENWQWQLPDIEPGQLISFRQVAAPVGSGVPPQFVPAILGKLPKTKGKRKSCMPKQSETWPQGNARRHNDQTALSRAMMSGVKIECRWHGGNEPDRYATC